MRQHDYYTNCVFFFWAVGESSIARVSPSASCVAAFVVRGRSLLRISGGVVVGKRRVWRGHRADGVHRRVKACGCGGGGAGGGRRLVLAEEEPRGVAEGVGRHQLRLAVVGDVDAGLGGARLVVGRRGAGGVVVGGSPVAGGGAGGDGGGGAGG